MIYELDYKDINADTETTDEQLLAAVSEKDEDALSTLYYRHRSLLRTIVSRVLNNDSEADDSVQEIFVEIWNQALHYDVTKGKALGWMVTLARRRSIDKLRRIQAYHRAGERLRQETESSSEPLNCHSADIDALVTDRSRILNNILKTIPLTQRDALQLAFYRGMSQREIAVTTGIPLGTIKTRIELGLRKMRSAVLSLGAL